MPITCKSISTPVLKTARIAAFMPGVSPPLVKTPIRFIFCPLIAYFALISILFLRTIFTFSSPSIRFSSNSSSSAQFTQQWRGASKTFPVAASRNKTSVFPGNLCSSSTAAFRRCSASERKFSASRFSPRFLNPLQRNNFVNQY